jgi:ATP-dependent RNA helicase SUPV3L1/SUV3
VIGTLRGFRFTPDSEARLDDRKRLIAAAELRLPRELSRRAQQLCEARDHEIALTSEAGKPVCLKWKGETVAALGRGKNLLSPTIRLDNAIVKLPQALRKLIEGRLDTWCEQLITHRLSALVKMVDQAQNPEAVGEMRAFYAQLSECGGVTSRTKIAGTLAVLSSDQRRSIRHGGVIIGALDVYHGALLKPEATRIRLALRAVRDRQTMPPLPMAGLGLLDNPAPALAAAARDAGYHSFGSQMLRVDLVERIARALHEQRKGTTHFVPERDFAVSLGIGNATLSRILRALGFVQPLALQPQTWRWRGMRRPPGATPTTEGGAFAALAVLTKGDRR